MKERPILFSGPMVRAILDGRKTQARRIVKPQPIEISWFEHQKGWCARVREGTGDAIHPAYVMAPCPYGIPGDRLWVRETFHYRSNKTAVVYEANLSTVEAAGDGALYGGWMPSIHMPRWASRITLEITEVRVQRVQEISEEDAVAEMGRLQIVTQEWVDDCELGSKERELAELLLGKPLRAYLSFMNLWSSINGPDSWAANPWVWCVSFKRVTA